jgi:GNAT superfamily N-acetyltransferase
MRGKERREGKLPQYTLNHWKPTDVSAISQLEKVCWAPWLQKPEHRIATIAQKFPETQLLLRNQQGSIVATMTAVRIDWDGNPASLTTWDAVVGENVETGDYIKTYKPEGTTLCITSSAIDPPLQGKGLAPLLMRGMQQTAQELGIHHLIGPFRPSGYGDYKLAHGSVDFAEYCAMTQENGEPFDPWLRSTFRIGLKPLRIEERSMVVDVPIRTFGEYQRTYHPQKWKEVEKDKWECGETGSWFVHGDRAIYIEPNIWGEIPL